MSYILSGQGCTRSGQEGILSGLLGILSGQGGILCRVVYKKMYKTRKFFREGGIRSILRSYEDKISLTLRIQILVKGTFF